LALLALLGGLLAGAARGERTQYGNLILSLKGGLSPLRLPRDRPAPVAVRLEGGLESANGDVLPKVARFELRLPRQAIVNTRGLPVCPQQRLRNTKSGEALAACGPALVGSGELEAEVLVPNQREFQIHARLLAFNGRVGRQRAVLLHGFSANPPTVVVLPLLLARRSGRLGTALVADLSAALGPWPRLAHFEVALSRRFSYRGRPASYLSASCPLPPILNSGSFSFARVAYTLANGRELSMGIPRGCRAR